MKVNEYTGVEKTQQETKQNEKERNDCLRERKGNNNNLKKGRRVDG